MSGIVHRLRYCFGAVVCVAQLFRLLCNTATYRFGTVATALVVGAMMTSSLLAPLSTYAQSRVELGTTGTNTVTPRQYQDNVLLTTVVWAVDLNPQPTKTEQALLRELVESAAVNFAGMIYGYRFSFVPHEPQRGVAELFALEPIGSIDIADPYIRSVGTWRNGEQLFAQFSYRAIGDKYQRVTLWKEQPTFNGGGIGFNSVWGEINHYENALYRALLDLVRRYVDNTYKNIPQQVDGTLLIRDGPNVDVVDGEYRARVFARLRVDNVENYEVF